MKLGIVILTHNQNDVTLCCLDSLDADMTMHPEYSVVVVDNGSADKFLNAALERNYLWKNRLNIIDLPKNLGVAGGRNCGLRAVASAEYILILDNDTIITEGSISSLIDYLELHKDVGIIAPELLSNDSHIQLSYKKFPGIIEKIRNLFGHRQLVSESLEESIEPFYVIGACQMIRGDAFRVTGFLDDSIFFGPEDADYCMRMRLKGYRVVYNPAIKIIHAWRRTSHRSPFGITSRRHISGLLHFYIKWKRFL